MQQINLEGEIAGYSKKTVALVAVIGILVLGSFYVGTRYEKNKLVRIMAANDQKAAKKLETVQKQLAAVTQVRGTIAKIENGIVTLTLADNTAQTVATTATTKYGETGTGTLADIAVGTAVAVTHTGIKNADGSLVAESIKPAPAATADTTKKKKSNKKAKTPAAATDAGTDESAQ